MRYFVLISIFCLASMFSAIGANAHDSQHGAGVTFEHVVIRGAQVFNGCSPELVTADVLVSKNLIAKIGPNLKAPNGALEITAKGHTLIPGLIDAHWHGVFAEATIG